MLPSLNSLDPPKTDDRPFLEPVLLVSLPSDVSLESLESLLLALLEPPDSNEASPLLLETVPVESDESVELVDVDVPKDSALEAIQSAP